MPPVQHIACPRQLHRLRSVPILQAQGLGNRTPHRQLRPSRHIQASLHHAIIPQRNPATGVRPQQAALPQRNNLLAAARQGSHDRGAATNISAIIDHHAGGNPALHHGIAQSAGIKIHKPLMHHGRPLRKMRPQPHPICVTNPHPGRHHIIHHTRELIHPIHHNRPPGLQLRPGGLKTGRQTRAMIRPHHICQ